VQEPLLVCLGETDRKGVKERKGLLGLFIYHFQFILFFKTLNPDEVNSVFRQTAASF
jgi:hypothetical protein